VFDEMKIREGFVFSNETGLIIGYVDTGDFNKHFKSFEAHLLKQEELEDEVATQMLSVCVYGEFS
jgi:hypothetical protein